MKKLLVLAVAALLAGALGWLPAAQKDVDHLLPAQTLILTTENGQFVLRGDADLHGEGSSWQLAVADLEETAPGEAFFGATAQIVLVDEAVKALPDVLQDENLRPAAKVYAGTGKPEPESATKFFAAHKEGTTIQTLQAAALEGKPQQLPKLRCEQGRYRIDNR